MTPVRQSTPSTLTLVPPAPKATDTPPPAPATQPKERHLTVAGKWFSRTHRNIEAPEIRLAGVYLQKLGFTIGSKVTVTENPGEIIVSLDGPSARRDPHETADDRRHVRKVKRVADYQERLPSARISRNSISSAIARSSGAASGMGFGVTGAVSFL